MKKQSKTFKILGAFLFLSFFALNVMFVVQADKTTGSISITQLQSSAQGSGDGVTINCDQGDYGKCSELVQQVCWGNDQDYGYYCDASSMDCYCEQSWEYPCL
jgi:hypothetical protein